MSMFSCFLDHCRGGFQFCEFKSERCQDCCEHNEECLINSIHISNYSRYCLDLMKNNMFLTMIVNTIPDGTYPAENCNYLIVCILSTLFMVSLYRQQRVQLLPKIVNIFKSSRHTTADPPDTHNDLHTTQRLMGEDENIFNDLKTEKKTNETMIENGDGVGMSNHGFRQHYQIQSATPDTPKLCISGSRIAT